jgi:hypothetical protein
MTATTAAPLVPSLRDRLATIIGSLKFDLPAPCAEYPQAAGDAETLSAGATAARLAVHEAPTNAAALKAYFDFFAALAGLTAEVEAVAVHCGTEINEMNETNKTETTGVAS